VLTLERSLSIYRFLKSTHCLWIFSFSSRRTDNSSTILYFYPYNMVIFCSMIFPFTDKIARCMLSYPYATREMKLILTDFTDKMTLYQHSYPYLCQKYRFFYRQKCRSGYIAIFSS
jgi:hypothetical protein